MDKKGQLTLGAAAGTILTFGAIFVTLGILMTVFEQQGIAYNEETVVRTNNETSAAYILDTTKKFNLTNTRVDNTSSIVLSNGTGNTVSASDYVVSYYAGGQAEINLTAAALQGNAVGVNYTYVAGSNSVAVNTTKQAREGLNNVTSFASVIGILIAVSLLLGLLFAGFMMLRRQ